jgi:hypothetical protein
MASSYRVSKTGSGLSPKSPAANRTLDRTVGYRLVSGHASRLCEYDGAAMTAGVFQTKDIRTSFITDTRHGIPVAACSPN